MADIYSRVGPPKNPPRNQGGTSGNLLSRVGPPKRDSQTSKDNQSLFRYLMKQLDKPVGATAATVRGISEFAANMSRGDIGGASKSIDVNLTKALDVLAGKKEGGWIDELRDSAKKAGLEPSKTDTIIGGALNLTADPLYMLKPIKALKWGGKVTKLDQPVSKATKLLSKTKPVKNVKSLFSTKTGNKAFDELVTKTRDLAAFRKGEAINDAVRLGKTIKKIGGGTKTENLIIDALENKKLINKITDSRVKDVVLGLQSKYKTFLDEAKGVGLKVDEVLEYAPRVTAEPSTLTKLKNFATGKEFVAPDIGASRSVRKFISQDGTEIIGTAKKNKLKPFEYLTKKGQVIKESKPGAQIISYKDKAGKVFKPDTFRVAEIRGTKLGKLYETDPAVAYAVRATAQAKAVAAKEFTNAVRQFASKADDAIAVENKYLKGLKFEPEIAKVIDNFYKGIQPEELKFIAKYFDKAQGIWKAQALMGPSYHLRNFAGNLWNNFLAGVNVTDYGVAAKLQKQALKATKEGKPLPKLFVEAQKNGVVNTGQFTADIAQSVKSSVQGGFKSGLNPFKQEFKGYVWNRALGSSIEDNAKLAHFITMKKKGMSTFDASQSVKKFLFDYSDLTKTEQNVFKRALPFYTWTKKNLPLQVEQLVKQPGKFSVPGKIINAIENREGNEMPNEKYMSKYISDNIPVRIRKNKDGDSEYFMLGQWLPYASAIDVLSQPWDNLIGMVTPFVKAPLELGFNKSTYFKNTLGEMQEIHARGSSSQAEFLGQTMNKKTIHLLRNIRMLNEINKLINKKDPRATQRSGLNKFMDIMIGKAATYDERKAKFFYDRDTENKVRELMASIKDARQAGDTEQAKKIREELSRFKKSRR